VAVSFDWDATPGMVHEPAPWVAPLKARLERAIETEQASSQTLGSPAIASLGVVVSVVFALATVSAGLVWPIWGVARWQGKWRLLAGLPLLAAGLWTLKVAVDLCLDSTSHNLLPFEYILGAMAVAPYMAILWLVRRRFHVA
jgi:hypothetical protein